MNFIPLLDIFNDELIKWNSFSEREIITEKNFKNYKSSANEVTLIIDSTPFRVEKRRNFSTHGNEGMWIGVHKTWGK